MATDRLVRLHFLNFTSLLAITGAASVRPDLDWRTLAGILAGAVCYHVFAYVLNDVIDLPVDRTQPLRADDLLVTGKVKPWQALALALAMVPLSIPITFAMGGGWNAVAVLFAGFGCMTIYNLWGKRCPVPPLTDLAQGMGWGSVSLWAALVVGGEINFVSWMAAAYGAGFILLINGVHGGLRDLDNDLASDRLTTSGFFGARPGTPRLPIALRVFAMSVQLGLVTVSLLPLLRHDLGLAPGLWWVVISLVGLLNVISMVFMVRVFSYASDTWQRDFRLHLLFLMLVPIALFGAYTSTLAAVLLVSMIFVPCVFLDITYEVAELVFTRLGLRSATAR